MLERSESVFSRTGHNKVFFSVVFQKWRATGQKMCSDSLQWINFPGIVWGCAKYKRDGKIVKWWSERGGYKRLLYNKHTHADVILIQIHPQRNLKVALDFMVQNSPWHLVFKTPHRNTLHTHNTDTLFMIHF